ncbi:MAG: hypothetical protein ACFFCQ_15820, partial [Promethearchaeota archaeon]
DWFVNSPITSKIFPVGLFSMDNPINFTITSSWGIKINGTRNPAYEPHLIWLSLPVNSSEGQGEVTVRLNNQLNETHAISWKRREFSSSPVEIQLSHHWFSYWTGSTLLKARLSENGTINIQHEILQLSHEENRKRLPYNKSFSFQNELSSYEWLSLMDYLLKHDSINWESWTYPPVNTQHPIVAGCDGGGFETSVKIIWNDTTDVTYNEMVDNDRCTGKRIYISSVTANFNDILLNLINKKISSYFQSRTVPSSSVITTDTSLFIFAVSSLAALSIGMTLAYLYEKIQKID